MSALRDIQSRMTLFGWTEGGGPGSVKFDSCNVEVARHGDAKWQRDVEYACYRAQKNKSDQDLMDEIETAAGAPHEPD